MTSFYFHDIINFGDVMKTLETDRLILRKFSILDAEGMNKNWANDPLTNKYLSWNSHKSFDETRELIRKWISEYDDGVYNWVVELKDNHEIIGNICEEGKSIKNKSISLGYCYGSKFWNNGYATEALRRVIKYLINEEGFYIVIADHNKENVASGRVMQKAGMKYDGTLRSRKIDKNGNRYDLVYYSITKDEL